jgi:hypothetical protein
MLKISNVYVYFCRWVKDPHDKIALYFCNQKNWVFFFNSNPRFHGIAQLEMEPADHPRALTKRCFLDLSQVLAMSPPEVANASDRDPVSDALLDRVIAALEQPINTLSPVHQELALKNFQDEKAARQGQAAY